MYPATATTLPIPLPALKIPRQHPLWHRASELGAFEVGVGGFVADEFVLFDEGKAIGGRGGGDVAGFVVVGLENGIGEPAVR